LFGLFLFYLILFLFVFVLFSLQPWILLGSLFHLPDTTDHGSFFTPPPSAAKEPVNHPSNSLQSLINLSPFPVFKRTAPANHNTITPLQRINPSPSLFFQSKQPWQPSAKFTTQFPFSSLKPATRASIHNCFNHPPSPSHSCTLSIINSSHSPLINPSRPHPSPPYPIHLNQTRVFISNLQRR
jgi:hypothetical protein